MDMNIQDYPATRNEEKRKKQKGNKIILLLAVIQTYTYYGTHDLHGFAGMFNASHSLETQSWQRECDRPNKSCTLKAHCTDTPSVNWRRVQLWHS
jgi:hypothetical protein